MFPLIPEVKAPCVLPWSLLIVLMDLMLPGRTGEEVMAENAGKVPVIVIFAKNELDSKIELLSAVSFLYSTSILQNLEERATAHIRRSI